MFTLYKLSRNYGKSQFLMRKLTINGHFQWLYVQLPEGITFRHTKYIEVAGISINAKAIANAHKKWLYYSTPNWFYAVSTDI